VQIAAYRVVAVGDQDGRILTKLLVFAHPSGLNGDAVIANGETEVNFALSPEHSASRSLAKGQDGRPA